MLDSGDVQSDELSRCLFNESNDAFFVIDPDDLSVIDVNPTARRITGLDRSDLIGRSIGELLKGDDEALSEDIVNSCRQTAFFHARDGYCLTSKDGCIDVSVSLSRLHGKSRTWSLVVLRDITTRKKLERSLKQSNQRYEEALNDLKQSRETITRQEQMRAVGHLARGVAHDLNNLLTPILTLSRLLVIDDSLAGTVRQQLQVIESSACDAAESVRRLSRYRFEETPVRRPVSVEKLVHELPGLTTPRWKTEQQLSGGPIEFDVVAESSLPFVMTVESELRQVLLNLVFNAIDAMPDGGQIRVHARSDTDGVAINVTDTGTGMTPDDLAHCLEMYYTTKREGAGLGLSLSRGIVEKHNGRIEVATDPGIGTTVSIWLPRAITRVDQTESEGSIALSLEDVSVLFIDDDENVRESVVMLLRTMNVSVEAASDGTSGVQMLAAADYDAVITDLGMNGVNGWDVIRRVRQLQPHVPVCVLTGWEESEIRREAGPDTMPDRILSKPVDARQLHDFLASATAGGHDDSVV